MKTSFNFLNNKSAGNTIKTAEMKMKKLHMSDLKQKTSSNRILSFFKESFKVGILVLTTLLLSNCHSEVFDFMDKNDKKLTSQQLTDQQLIDIETSVNAIYNLKKACALQFNEREKINIPDVFSTEEVKAAVLYKFLYMASMGMVKEYFQEVEILEKEIQKNQNGEVIVPCLEKVISLTVPLNSEQIESNFTDKHFFIFEETDGQFRLKKMETLLENYSNDTPYSAESVEDYAITSSELEAKVNTNDEYRIMLEERQIFTELFLNKINLNIFSIKLSNYFEKNNLLPAANELKVASSFSRSKAVSYALNWTSNSGDDATSSYNNSVYRYYKGKDCANFCSQCLKAGGWTNDTPLTNWNLWWYNNNNTTKTSDDNGSTPWVGANALYNYVVPSYASKKSITQAHAGSVSKGDLFWQPASGTKTHAMIVTTVAGACLPNGSYYYYIYYSGHSNNRWNKLLSTTDFVFGHIK